MSQLLIVKQGTGCISDKHYCASATCFDRIPAAAVVVAVPM